MRSLTCAVVLAIAFLAADTTPASTTGGGGSIDCSGAALSQGVIWPPNHTMVPETIMGVSTDTALAPVTITITSIYQDEPVDALGSGNTAPDGAGVGGSTAYVRAERAGPGTGRIYFISFTAADGSGTSCSGTLTANVPHDQGQGYTPIDTGVQYNSTLIPP